MILGDAIMLGDEAVLGDVIMFAVVLIALGDANIMLLFKVMSLL